MTATEPEQLFIPGRYQVRNVPGALCVFDTRRKVRLTCYPYRDWRGAEDHAISLNAGTWTGKAQPKGGGA